MMKSQLLVMISLLICISFLAACGSSEMFMDGNVAYAVPGKTVNLSIIMAPCVKGYWSSDDLQLILNAPNGEVFFEGHTSRPQEWDETLDIKDDMPVVSADFKVAIPENIPVGTIFNGKMTGAMFCPQISGVKTEYIRIANYDLDEDVELHISNEKEIRTLTTNNFWEIIGGALVCVLIGAVVIVVGSLLKAMKPKY
jgi:hypothetical protein